MILHLSDQHYRIPRHQFPPLTPYDPRWPAWSDQWRNDNELIENTWGHLPQRWKEHYLGLYRRHQQGLLPALDPEFLWQLAEGIAEHWDLFGPIIEEILARTKAERKKEPCPNA